jgi:hypothetical protein
MEGLKKTTMNFSQNHCSGQNEPKMLPLQDPLHLPVRTNNCLLPGNNPQRFLKHRFLFITSYPTYYTFRSHDS